MINYSIRDNGAAADTISLLFTDADGQVLYADNHFLEMVDYPKSGNLAGQPLHKVLGIDRQLVAQFLQNLTEIGYVHNWVLELQTESGQAVLTRCTAVATYDERDVFIGADLALSLYREHHPIEVSLTHHRDALNTRIRQIQAEAPNTRTLLELYLTIQISALQVLLARMAGPRVCKTQDMLISNMIAQKHWPLDMKDGELTFLSEDIDPAIYFSLLSETARYAASIVGRRMVMREMRTVDDQMDTQSRRIADEVGLRSIFDNTK